MRLAAALAFGLALAAPAFAAPDDGFAAFWKVFAAAVAKDDAAALEKLTVLGPGLADWDAWPLLVIAAYAVASELMSVDSNVSEVSVSGASVRSLSLWK